MIIFLTGERHIGKSTVVRAVLERIALPFGGFQTYFTGDRSALERCLYLADIRDCPIADERRMVARFVDGRPRAEPDVFDTLGGHILREARAQARLIVMDECGSLEKNAFVFQQEVLKTLNANIPVLGVVRQNAGGWTRTLIEHPNVHLVTVTFENRNALPNRIVRRLEKPITQVCK